MNPSESENSNPQSSNLYTNFNSFGAPQAVPNSVGVLVLGILSIVFCWCYGLLSIILGIIAIVLASQGEKSYLANPQAYTLSSYNNLKAGRVCAIIGLSIGALVIIFFVIAVIINGVAALNGFGRF